MTPRIFFFANADSSFSAQQVSAHFFQSQVD